jgi:uncharacterized membrane protein YfcA
VTAALVALSVTLAACVQATSGMGFALLLSPVLLVVLAPVSAIALLTGLGLTLNLLVLFRRTGPRHIAWSEVGPLLIASVPGSIGGLLVLRAIPKPALQAAVGAGVMSLMLVRALQQRSGPRRPPTSERRGQVARWRMAVGVLSGALSTAAGINGPPLALWLSGRGIGVVTIRDSLAACFLGMGLITAVTLLPTVSSVHLSPLIIAGSGPAVLAGHALGNHLRSRLAAERISRMLALLIVASGASALIFGLSALG